MKGKMKNKNGFILSLDAFLAVIIMGIVFSFVVSSFFQTPERIQDIYSIKEANDAIAVLDYGGVLDSFDEEDIANSFSNLLGSSEAKFNITSADVELTSQEDLLINWNKTEKDFVISGKRFFVIKNSTETVDKFAVVRYFIWKK